MALRLALFGPIVAAALGEASFSFLASGASGKRTPAAPEPPLLQAFENSVEALKIMQEDYFAHWLGTWPTAIDWTAAVMGSHVAGGLSSVSRGLGVLRDAAPSARENLVGLHFSEILASYFGQAAFEIRQEAFDDMLWVVLQWLDAITFINLHTDLHYSSSRVRASPAHSGPAAAQNQTWHGSAWTPAFAHRARIFWELAAKGWDTKLCNGGMIWNPRLKPYKNAITNELFIAASISMYLHFPGDYNDAPFSAPTNSGKLANPAGFVKPHDPKFLRAAVDGYTWLARSGMMNRQGLYVDGFHISGPRNGSHPNTKCDVRSEMVFTYNQGVILSGQIGLWQVSANPTFLQDGHKLIQSVIAATGYDLDEDHPVDDILKLRPGKLPPWRGLGRGGVLEETCDIHGSCSQDSQTFKGIFFHHLTTFCAPLQLFQLVAPSVDPARMKELQEAHVSACRGYTGWLRHNAMAALLTRDENGHFGMWWTAGLLSGRLVEDLPADAAPFPPGMESFDYRTFGVPDDELWLETPRLQPRDESEPDSGTSSWSPRGAAAKGNAQQHPMSGTADSSRWRHAGPKPDANVFDPNNRGRGRTVETQGGGVAVLRALWELSRLEAD